MNENSATLQASAIVPAGRSVLDIAADREKRQGLLRHLEATGKKKYEGQQYVEMEAYLLSDDCVEDLGRLGQGGFFLCAAISLSCSQKRIRGHAGCLRLQGAGKVPAAPDCLGDARL